MTTSAVDRSEREGGARRVVTPVGDLDALIGAHPDALLEIYRAGRPADPAELGDAPRGRLLCFASAASVHLALRPLVRSLAGDASPWRGKTFDHGGNSGQNVLFGKAMFRFRAERADSLLDGRPTLTLRYDAAAHGNPWPVRSIVDELRSVGPGVAIGPAFFGKAQLIWFGLQR